MKGLNSSHLLAEIAPYALVSSCLYALGLTDFGDFPVSGVEVLSFPPGVFRMLGWVPSEFWVVLPVWLLPTWKLFLVSFVIPVPRIRWVSGLGLSLIATLVLGIKFSSGKVDHVLLIHVLPALIVLDEYFKQSTLFVRTGLALFFLSSAVAKIFGGWLGLDELAVRSWLFQYEQDYWISGTGAWLLTLPVERFWSVFKLLDYLVIGLESAIAVWALLLPKLKRYWSFWAVTSGFHFGVRLLLEVGFFPLQVVYWWVVQPEGRKGYWAWVGLGSVISVCFIGVVTVNDSLMAIFLFLFGGFVCVGFSSSSKRLIQPTRNKGFYVLYALFLVYGGLNLVFYALGRDIYPALTGPRFSLSSKTKNGCRPICQYEIVAGCRMTDYERRRLKQYALVEYPARETLECLHHLHLPDKPDRFRSKLSNELSAKNGRVTLSRRCIP